MQHGAVTEGSPSVKDKLLHCANKSKLKAKQRNPTSTNRGTFVPSNYTFSGRLRNGFVSMLCSVMPGRLLSKSNMHVMVTVKYIYCVLSASVTSVGRAIM